MGKRSKRLHKKMWSIHNWVGLYAGVVIAVLSITGVVALFKLEIDKALNSHLYKVEVPRGSQRIDITPVLDSIKTALGEVQFVQVTVPKKPADSWIYRTNFRKSTFDIIDLEVFVDPYTGRILGQRNYYKSVAYFIRNIHVRLYDGLFGRYFVGLFGMALVVSTVTGLWIYGGFMKRQLFATIRKKNIRVTFADYHKLIGVATLIFNLVIGITGAWLGLQGLLQRPLVGPRPGTYQVAEKPISKAGDMDYRFNYLEVEQKARQLFPELEPSYMTVSHDGSRTITVRGDVPRTAFERDHFQLTLDKQDLKELHRLDIRKAGLGAKLFYIQESMHFGDWGGIFLKIVYAFFGVTSGFLALTGFIVYLKRTETKRRERPRFIELKPLLIRWVLGILAVMLLLLVLALLFGVAVPSLLVILSLYGTLIFLLIRALVLFVRRRIRAMKLKVD